MLKVNMCYFLPLKSLSVIKTENTRHVLGLLLSDGPMVKKKKKKIALSYPKKKNLSCQRHLLREHNLRRLISCRSCTLILIVRQITGAFPHS